MRGGGRSGSGKGACASAGTERRLFSRGAEWGRRTGVPAHALAHPSSPAPPPTALREIACTPIPRPRPPSRWDQGRSALQTLPCETRPQRPPVDAILEGFAAVHAEDGDFGAVHLDERGVGVDV